MRFHKLFIGLASLVIGAAVYAAPATANSTTNKSVALQSVTSKTAGTPAAPVGVNSTTIQNLSIGTTVVDSGPGRPQIGIELAAPAQIQISKDSTVLLTTNLPAGVSYLDTSNFPVGTYAVNILVKQGNLSFNVSQNITIKQ